MLQLAKNANFQVTLLLTQETDNFNFVKIESRNTETSYYQNLDIKTHFFFRNRRKRFPLIIKQRFTSHFAMSKLTKRKTHSFWSPYALAH